MHHVYPNECPYPHESGVVNPQTPGEWMRDGGHESAHVTDEEMRWVVSSDTCPAWSSDCGQAGDDYSDLPWSNIEELLILEEGRPMPQMEPELKLAHAVSAAGFLIVGLVAGALAHKNKSYQQPALVVAASALSIAAAL
eukprot:4564967-Amphidinium_carterae.1